MANKLLTVFMQIEDKRRDVTVFHDLNDILLMAIIAVICGANSWNEIERYCNLKVDWLRGFLKLENDIPSHDTFNRVISSIDNEQLEKCFMEWVNTLIDSSIGLEIINIDGKTINGAKEHGKKSLIHMVSAWACKNNLVLGQVKVDEKSNEITAIPKLLELLSVQGSIITIDAMGCQVLIAEEIVKQGADYVLAVKGNQPKLYENIIDEFRFLKAPQFSKQYELDQGRIETRTCTVIKDFQFIENQYKWKSLTSLVRIESTRSFKNSSKKDENSVRYYISSADKNAEEFQDIIRLHWSIENKLHWTLDIAFREDLSRKRKDNGAQNFSLLTKIALNLLKNDKSVKIGIKGKRLIAGWDNKFIEKLLGL